MTMSKICLNIPLGENGRRARKKRADAQNVAAEILRGGFDGNAARKFEYGGVRVCWVFWGREGWDMESGIRAFAAFGAAVANWAAAAFGAHGPEMGSVFGDFPRELPLHRRHVELVFRFPPPVEISRPERHFALQTLVRHSVYFAALFKQGTRLDKAKRRVAFDAFGV